MQPHHRNPPHHPLTSIVTPDNLFPCRMSNPRPPLHPRHQNNKHHNPTPKMMTAVMMRMMKKKVKPIHVKRSSLTTHTVFRGKNNAHVACLSRPVFMCCVALHCSD